MVPTVAVDLSIKLYFSVVVSFLGLASSMVDTVCFVVGREGDWTRGFSGGCCWGMDPDRCQEESCNDL